MAGNLGNMTALPLAASSGEVQAFDHRQPGQRVDNRYGLTAGVSGLFRALFSDMSNTNLDVFTDVVSTKNNEMTGGGGNERADLAEATATANTLADISTLISQQSKNYNADRLAVAELNEIRPRRGRVAEHPCWELVQRVDEHNCMICRLCSKVVKTLNTRNAMQHFSSCHPQIAVELDQSWQMKLQLKADFNRISTETSYFHRSMWKRRGRAAEHPSWRYFCRINRKSSNCKLCGVHVAYACSGNLMKHLKSRHLAEFAITQREWEEILKRKKQLCELRLKVSANASGSEEQSPSNFLSFEYGDDEQDDGLGEIDRMKDEEDVNVALIEQNNVKETDRTMTNGDDSDLGNLDEKALAEQHDATMNPSEADGVKMSDVGETANRILQSIDFSTHPPKSPSPILQQQGSWLTQSSFVMKNDAFKRRISFFVNGLAEDLASFPLEKSLLCMRQIRKYMDEKLLGLEGSMQNSEVDINIV